MKGFSWILALSAVALAAPGCARDRAAADRSTPGGADKVRPAAAEPPPRVNPEAEAASAGVTAPRYTMDGMVGQVNGRAIFASAVFEPVHTQLQTLGRQLPRHEFESQAARLIRRRITEIVENALILGEAERDLSAQERRGLRAFMKRKREEMLRRFGQGSLALAEETIKAQAGQTLDEMLEDYRVGFVINRHLQQTLRIKINVTRRDIERYYNDHHDEFNPPETRTLRLIKVLNKPDADRVTESLGSGQSFEQVASSELNFYKRDSGGLMAATGDEVFGQPRLNEAMLELNEQEHSGEIHADGTHWFLFVEKIERSKPRSLMDVQLNIRKLLEDQQERALSDRYRKRLLDEGSFTPLEQMSAALLEIAMVRYADGGPRP